MRPYPLAQRQAALARLAEGASIRQVAAELGLSGRTLRRWQQRQHQTGTCAARSPPGRPRRLTPERLAALTAELRVQPTMTLAQMRAWLQLTQQLNISTATIDRALHRLGWRFRSRR
jgi:transposase